MIIRITNKVNKKIKIDNLVYVKNNGEAKFFEEWYINLLVVNRKTYFIFTEGFSLFSIIKYGKGINTKKDLEEFFKKSICELFKELAPELKLENIPVKNIQFSKTENGRILKNQSDQIYHAKRYAEDGKNTFQVNRIPLKAIGFEYPVDIFVNEIQKMFMSNGFIWMSDIEKN